MNAVTVIPVHNGSKRVLKKHSFAQWETVVESELNSRIKNVLNLHTHPSLIKARERENILCLLLSGSRVHSINTALAELNDSA